VSAHAAHRRAIGAPELRRPVQVVDRHGSIEALPLDPDGHVSLFVELVLQGQRGLVEVVRASRGADGQLRMRSRRDPEGYVELERPGAVVRLASRARGRGEEVFVTPLPRSAPEPGKGAVAPGSVVWVDLDGERRGSELGRLAALRPCLTVHSGGGLHCYWRVTEELEPAEIESLNRRLCRLVGGDQACTDRGRIMRLPGTFNGRRGRWCRVLKADRSRAPVDPEQVRRAIPDPEPPRLASAPRLDGNQGGPVHEDELARIDPPTYFRALAGVAVPAEGGLIPCPLPDHDDSRASCQVFAEAERGWWCFGCARGGRIYDLASLMSGGPWGRELRGGAFWAAREVVAAAVG
jgi:RepB DNA-primase from phage plasmid